MNPWIALIIGLLVGWLIELLIDLFYWRKRRLCPEDEALNLKASLEQTQHESRTLQLSLDENKGRIGQLKADLAARDGRVAALTADLDARMGEIDGLNGRVGELEAAVADRDAELATLRAELNGKNAELSQIHAQLSDVDGDMEGLGLGSLFAGGSLALGSFFTNLKDRFSREAKVETRGTELDLTLAAKEAEIEGLNLQVDDLEKKLSVCNASLLEMRTNLGTDFKGAQGLSMVWGINTAASDLLANRGIYTYNQLAATEVDDVNEAIELSGQFYPEMDNVEIHGSWVEQSRLAASNDWDDLYAYQQQRFDLINMRDDLKKIWGIGPKVEQVMNDNGIYTFAQMASVPPDRITEILRRAGSRFSMSTGKLHDTWPEQARLADQGDWDAFQELQDTLDWSRLQGE